jgi:hypothetical protein
MDPDATLPAPGPSADPEALMAGPERAARRLVLLHGWGADADDLLDLGQELVDATVSVVALRAPQLAGLAGARQRSGPTGGAANGTPRNCVTLPPVTPVRLP